MKNIHLLETSNPSRLGLHKDLGLHLHDNSLTKNPPHFLPQYIYITSKEEIKEGVYQWYIDDFLGKIRNSGGSQYSSKQDIVILTNDPDLIADGVQDISDEFLEWFIKNPNRENVELSTYHIKGDISGKLHYKIIIPKEEKEPSKELIYYRNRKVKFKKDLNDAMHEAHKAVKIIKQETLEEAAEKYENSFKESTGCESVDFIAGAKWQQENIPIHILDVTNVCVRIKDGAVVVEKNDKSIKDYSEDEVLKLLKSCKDSFSGSDLDDYVSDSEVEVWFNRHKK